MEKQSDERSGFERQQRILAAFRAGLGDVFDDLVRDLGFDAIEPKAAADTTLDWAWLSWAGVRNKLRMEVALCLEPAWFTQTSAGDLERHGEALEIDVLIYPDERRDVGAPSFAEVWAPLLAQSFPTGEMGRAMPIAAFPNMRSQPVPSGMPFLWRGSEHVPEIDSWVDLSLRAAPQESGYSEDEARKQGEALAQRWRHFRGAVDYLRGALGAPLKKAVTKEAVIGVLGEARFALATPGPLRWLGGYADCDFVTSGDQFVEVKAGRSRLPSAPFFSPAELTLGMHAPERWNVVLVALPAEALDAIWGFISTHSAGFKVCGAGELFEREDRAAAVERQLHRFLGLTLDTMATGDIDEWKRLLAAVLDPNACVLEAQGNPFQRGWGQDVAAAVKWVLGPVRLALPQR